MAIQIVPITEALIEGFCAAVDSVARERQFLAFLEGPPLVQSQAFVRDNLAGSWPHFVALDEQGEVVGWCDVTSMHRQAAAHVGVLGIGVLADYRGQGLGEQLLRAALQAARDKGLTRVELSVHGTNEPAMVLYHKLGFEVEGVKRKAVLIDGVYDDSIIMALLMGAAKIDGQKPSRAMDESDGRPPRRKMGKPHSGKSSGGHSTGRSPSKP
jgi:RimJ/RimL family protein N-acetyltransferase